ncbi:hypothetical protein [Streptomyces chryseus]|uniref:Secreted protein n=1 Tax=Streptomyces chryseus TaxID=68186 RepID=A0ABQ3DJQ6_9ACTN|nr:hypothetical protein [Streptomyces chryseus]GHA93986.1 hypothetical protein GCM10010346_15870 [Streptomyces chryseus]
MSTFLLAAMAATFIALVASVVAHRRATDVTADEHSTSCRHCAALRHPSQLATRAALSTIPGQKGGE